MPERGLEPGTERLCDVGGENSDVLIGERDVALYTKEVAALVI